MSEELKVMPVKNGVIVGRVVGQNEYAGTSEMFAFESLESFQEFMSETYIDCFVPRRSDDHKGEVK